MVAAIFRLNLSVRIDADTLLQPARIGGVSYRPGTAFSASGGSRFAADWALPGMNLMSCRRGWGGWEMPLTGALATARSAAGLRRKVWVDSPGYNYHHAKEYDYFRGQVLTITGRAGIFGKI